VPDDDSSRIFLVEVYRNLKAREAHMQGPLLPLVKDAQKDMIVKRRIVLASI
jgi:quinol monooxygenase YgiN